MRKRSGFFAYWPSQIKVFIILLTLAASGILLAAADFGESSASLGQITDEYDTLDNVSVRVEVVRNATLNAMELNQSSFVPAYEDFTTFTEFDPDGDLTITSAVIVDWNTMRRDSDSHAWKDYGVDYFGDFEVKFTLDITDIEAGDLSSVAICWPFAFSNSDQGSSGVFATTGLVSELFQDGANDDRFKFRLAQIGFWNAFGAGVWDVDTYYLTINRTGTAVFLRVYDDSARTNLIETISNGAGDTTKYRYVEVAVGYDNAGDAADHSTGSIEYLDLGGLTGGYASEGYFTTTDYLDYVNGSTLALMTQSKLPPNTHITIQFSDDNATWGDAEGIPGDSHDLDGGLETIDLRPLNESGSLYVMANLTTTDPNETPLLNQTRLITTEGPIVIVSGAPGQNVTGEWILYNVTQFNASIGIIDAGNITATYFLDGDTFNLSETVGPPGMIISMNFTGIDQDAECLWLVINAYYDGNFNHDFDIQAYNFTSSAWVDIGHITDGIDFEWFNASIYGLRVPVDFINGSGAVLWRLYHTAPGNINHDIFIDYIKLHAKIPSDVLPAGAVTVLNIESDFPWIAIAIILMCVAYLLFRPK